MYQLAASVPSVSVTCLGLSSSVWTAQQLVEPENNRICGYINMYLTGNDVYYNYYECNMVMNVIWLHVGLRNGLGKGWVRVTWVGLGSGLGLDGLG